MKTFRYYIAAFAALSLAACDMSDPGGPVELRLGGAREGSNPEANARIAQMNETYGVIIQYEFDEATFAWNWTEMLPSDGMPYTPADPDAVVAVLDFLENKVFSVFPEGLIEKNLQPTILLVDEMQRAFEWGWDWYFQPTVRRTAFNNLSGNTTRTSLVLAGVNSSFDPDDEELKEAWISLIIERMMMAGSRWPRPAEFIRVTNPTGATGSLLDTHWTNGSVVDPNYWASLANLPGGIWAYGPDEHGVDQWMNVLPVSDADASFAWWRVGLLKPGRLGFTGISWWSITEDFVWGTIVIPGSDTVSIRMAKPSVGQDMGDFFVFITTKTAAEKEAFYDRIISGPGNTGGQNSVNLIKQKIELCKQYFYDNFGIVLSEPN